MLPFANETGDPEFDHWGDAIAEAAIDALSHVGRLRVVPRSKSFRYRDQADDAQTVGQKLEVRALLSGRLAIRNDMLLVRAELIDVAKDSQLWSAQFSCNIDELPGIEEEIARCVIEKLKAPSSGPRRKGGRKAAAAPAPAPALAHRAHKDADSLFVRGNEHVIEWTADGLQSGIELYQQAIDIDARHAPAWACMAMAYAMLTVAGRVDTAEAFRRAKAAALQAIELDEGLSEAHAALSLTETFADFNLPKALWHGERALELNPNSAIARYAYAQTLSACGRLDEALEHARAGCELDPLMAPINYCYGLVLDYQRCWDEAGTQFQRTLEINPNFFWAQAVLAVVLARAGHFPEAMAQAHELLLRNDDVAWGLLLGYLAALAGDSASAENALAQLESAPVAEGAYFAAAICGALGDMDNGFAQLERARDAGFAVLATVAVDPALDPFRSDPRWEPFLHSMEALAEAVRELPA